MPLTLTLKQQPKIPLEVDQFDLDRVREQSLLQISKTLIQQGNQQLELGNFFEVQGSAADDFQIIWEGDCSCVKGIGTKLSQAKVKVIGQAGMHLGSEMTGGEVFVQGDASDWIGTQMKGGRIVVQGNAGHCIGTAFVGGARGMSGGEILIHGNAGEQIGHLMRRGTIVINGSSGSATGKGMIAGSILLGGPTGNRLGAQMKRGTIVVFDPGSDWKPLPTFQDSGCFQPVFLKIFIRHLKSQGLKLPAANESAYYKRYSGDFLESGHGEILVQVRS